MAKKIISLLVLCAFLTGCGSSFNPVNPPNVEASTPSTLSITCPAPVFSQDDGSGLLKLAWGPCPLDAHGSTPVSAEAEASITLSHPMSAKILDNWIGTAAKSKVEVGMELIVTLPDGRKRYFAHEYDKDADTLPGQVMRQWNLPMNLPAGTTFQLKAFPGVTNPSTDCPLTCAVDTVWIFNDDLK